MSRVTRQWNGTVQQRKLGKSTQRAVSVRSETGLQSDDFVRIAANGFGDPQNSYAFSMAWFDDCLYVGTARNLFQLIGASPPKHAAALTPWPVPQPKDVFKTDLRAQIWRYNPSARGKHWRRIYTSPVVNGSKGQETPRDIGYRHMTVFRPARDRQDALYIATASSDSRGPGAHILRYTEAKGMAAISKPGFGDQSVSTFRTLIDFNGRLYSSPTGSGRAWNAARRPCVYETTDPINGKWRSVSGPKFGDATNDALYSMAVFNNHLYVGTLNPKSGYQVWKTPAVGKPPYRWTKVVDAGAGRGNLNEAVVTMCVFDGALYVGSGISNGGYDRTYQVGPAAGEIIRIHPDDTWDLVVGTSRNTVDGYKLSLSGLTPGFDNPFAGYIWSMAVHEGWLYVGTFDSSIFLLWADPKRQSIDRQVLLRFQGVDNFVRERAGFELWRSPDGVHWSAVTRNGFCNPYNYGIRTMASTPGGLFIGTANPFGPKVAARFADGWQYVSNPNGGAEVWLGSSNNGNEQNSLPPANESLILGSDCLPEQHQVTNDESLNRVPEASLPPRLQEVERAWRAAAAKAADASFKYHLIRLLSAVARRTFVTSSSLEAIPEWAKEIRHWEGNLRGGASQRAGIEAIKASRNYHLASARRERVRWHLARSLSQRQMIAKKYWQHLKDAKRASRRLVRVLIRNRGDVAASGTRRRDDMAASKFAGDVIDFYDHRIYQKLPPDFHGTHDFLNFGFWTPDTRSRREASENLMEELLALIPRKQGNILDVACGKGATTRYLLNYYRPSQVTGINISEKQLTICRKQAPKCKFLKMDATRLSFPNESFDAVVSVEAAFHFNTREQFLREAFRVLRHGGHLVLSDILRTRRSEEMGHLFLSQNHIPGPAEYEALLQKIGFNKINIHDVTEQTWGGYLRHLTRFLNAKLRRKEISISRFNQLMRSNWGQVPDIRYYLLAGARKP